MHCKFSRLNYHDDMVLLPMLLYRIERISGGRWLGPPNTCCTSNRTALKSKLVCVDTLDEETVKLPIVL